MARSERINTDGNILRYENDSSNQVGLYVAAEPLTPENNYFSITIICAGRRGAIGLGLVHELYPLHRMPGWDNRSVGYHADDGKLFEGQNFGRPFGQTCTAGDTMGCGVEFTEEGNIHGATCNVFFTRNGLEIGRVRRSSTMLGTFPAVGMWSCGESVEMNLQAKWEPPFPCFERVHVDGDILRYVDDCSGQVGAYIAAQPLTPENNYFEVLILDTGIRGTIGVGLAHYMYSTNAQPGWQKDSVGYHADDGKLFEADGGGRSFGATCGVGDVIGCGIKFRQSQDVSGQFVTVCVFFTRNGQEVGTVQIFSPMGGFHPAVGLHSEGEKVRLNLRARPARHQRISIDGDSLRYADNCFGEVGVYVAAHQLTEENNYFEVQIMDAGMRGKVGVGLVHNNYSTSAQPGWQGDSIGYHADDGRLFEANGLGRPFGATCSTGDVIGCGIQFGQSQACIGSRTTVCVFFTRNGQEVGTVCRALPTGGFYPAVGLHSEGEMVRLNLRAPRPSQTEVDHEAVMPKLARFERISISGDTLRYDRHCSGIVGGYVAAEQLTAENNFFEVTILDTGLRGAIGVGLAHERYSLSAMPGWQAGSVGYHADDGKVFEGRGQGRIFGENCGEGDVIGCGIKFQCVGETCGPNTVDVFFMRNGHEIGTVRTSMPPRGLYPAVGMLSQGEGVRLNLSAKWIVRPKYEEAQDASDQTVTADNQCAVCWDAKADHAMVPCGHRSFCGNCANTVFRDKKECPICRVRIERVLKLY